MPPSIKHMIFFGIIITHGCTAIQKESEVTTLEFLYMADCPNSPEMKASLLKAIENSEHQYRLVETDLMSLEEGDHRLRFGAPTVLIDGKDLFGAKPAATASATCRMYPGHLPTAKEITARLSLQPAP